MIFIYISAILLSAIIFIIIIKLFQLSTGNKKVLREIEQIHYDKISFGSVKEVSILPLVDFYTDNQDLKTEPGVSYLIKAGEKTILMDFGFNKKKEHPSPLLHNMKKLNISIDDVDMMFLSHRHLDHLGGMDEQRKKVFSLSQGATLLSPDIPVYSPVELAPSHWNPGPKVEIINEPRKLAEGLASIGTIPRNLFAMGYTLENSLAVHVENKGIVLIIGCGHQTIERIIERSQMLFDEPIYGIIGGLHYPVKDGRVMAGPFNVQNIVGSDKAPWRGINEDDVASAINAIKKVNPQFISLSPHDSSDWTIEKFREAFKGKYHDLKVGSEIVI